MTKNKLQCYQKVFDIQFGTFLDLLTNWSNEIEKHVKRYCKNVSKLKISYQSYQKEFEIF